MWGTVSMAEGIARVKALRWEQRGGLCDLAAVEAGP